MLPFRSGRAGKLAAAGLVFPLALISHAAISASAQPASSASPSPGSFSTVPLPVGQEAKGIVFPDFDLQGRMRARFEAGVAKRIDTDHLQFSSLKMTTFTPENEVELLIEMPTSRLNLNTRVLMSEARTTVQRRDFSISGDQMQFDINARTGTLRGNVKMIITDQSELLKKPGE